MKRMVTFSLLAGVALIAFACGRGEEAPPADTAALPVSERVPPAIPHELTDRSECKSCHGSEAEEIPREPATHAGRTDQLCTFCHKEAGETATGSVPIPHSLVGRAECLECHGAGVAGAPLVPEKMADLSEGHCLLCHWPLGTPVLLVNGSVEDGTPAPPVLIVGTEEASKVPPTIPHELTGRSDCIECHGGQISEIPSLLASHEGRTEQQCTVCHKQLGEHLAASPEVPHTLTGRTDCLICHRTGLASAPAVTEEMADQSSKRCLLCHWAGVEVARFPTTAGDTPAVSAPTQVPVRVSPSPEAPTVVPGPATAPTANPTPSPTAPALASPPSIPHPLEGRSDCLACHKATLPATHAERPNELCALCHKPAEAAAPTPTLSQTAPSGPAATTTSRPTPGPTAIPVATATPTLSPTVTPGPAATATSGPTPGPTTTPVAAATPTRSPTATPVPAATATSGPTPGPTATPVAAATPTPEATATPTPEPEVTGPPLIPHALEGRTDCLACHKATLPTSHEGRLNTMCMLCHKTKE
jgi:hypothetical protein